MASGMELICSPLSQATFGLRMPWSSLAISAGSTPDRSAVEMVFASASVKEAVKPPELPMFANSSNGRPSASSLMLT